MKESKDITSFLCNNQNHHSSLVDYHQSQIFSW